MDAQAEGEEAFPALDEMMFISNFRGWSRKSKKVSPMGINGSGYYRGKLHMPFRSRIRGPFF